MLHLKSLNLAVNSNTSARFVVRGAERGAWQWTVSRVVTMDRELLFFFPSLHLIWRFYMLKNSFHVDLMVWFFSFSLFLALVAVLLFPLAVKSQTVRFFPFVCNLISSLNGNRSFLTSPSMDTQNDINNFFLSHLVFFFTPQQHSLPFVYTMWFAAESKKWMSCTFVRWVFSSVSPERKLYDGRKCGRGFDCTSEKSINGTNKKIISLK